jgi:hypothetical protein
VHSLFKVTEKEHLPFQASFQAKKELSMSNSDPNTATNLSDKYSRDSNGELIETVKYQGLRRVAVIDTP